MPYNAAISQTIILLVEDDPATRDIMADILRKKYPSLYLAENGEEGFARYEEVWPDIVITDIMMPRMNGLEMAQRIRTINPDALIILVTAHSEIQYLINSIEIGINYYVLKPVDTTNLFRTIEKCQQTLRERNRLHELEKELQRLEKLEALGVFAGGLAHDFNNLLAVILGYIYLSQEIKSFDLLEKAETACHMAEELTKRLLLLAKGRPISMEVTPLPLFLTEVVNFILDGTNVNAAFDISPDLHQVKLARDQFRQVINNIVLNAVESMPQGGQIEVMANNCALEQGNPLSLEVGDYIRVSIRDQGRGIPPEILPKVFDPYFSTKDMGPLKGQGLGLTICHAIIHKHGGAISLESTLGRGTICQIYIPAMRGAA